MKVLLLAVFYIMFSTVHAEDGNLIKLDSDFNREEKFNKTVYLSIKERRGYLAKVKKGFIMEHENVPLDTRLLPNGTAMFVLSKDGQLYVSKKRIPLKFDHSSLVAGEPVVCAGTMKIRRGQLEYITDVSPMYKTKDKKPLEAVMKKLRELGVDVSKTRLFFQVDY